MNGIANGWLHDNDEDSGYRSFHILTSQIISIFKWVAHWNANKDSFLHKLGYNITVKGLALFQRMHMKSGLVNYRFLVFLNFLIS